MNKYDYIIVGAGLAGTVLGFLLKQQNKKVLIIEHKDSNKKAKLCGGILTPKSYELLVDIYGKSITRLNFRKYNNCYINNKNKDISLNKTFYTIFRKDLDDFVLNEYLSCGGELIDKASYESLNINDKLLTIKGDIYKFEYLIGADGVHSKLRKDLTNNIQGTNFALESYLSTENNKDLKIYFSDEFKGYGWIIPNDTNVIVGIGNVSGKSKIQEDYNSYLKHIDADIEDKKGAFLPNGKDICLEYNNYIKFIGDAAGLISPITGEGIFYAIASANILSRDFNDYSINMRKIVSKIKLENIFKRFVYNHKIRNFVFKRYESKIFNKVIEKFIKIIL